MSFKLEADVAELRRDIDAQKAEIVRLQAEVTELQRLIGRMTKDSTKR